MLNAYIIEELKKIAEVLEVTTDYLLFDNVPKSGRIEINDPELLEKFSLVDGLNEKNREVLKCIIDALVLKGKIEGLTGQEIEITVILLLPGLTSPAPILYCK